MENLTENNKLIAEFMGFENVGRCHYHILLDKKQDKENQFYIDKVLPLNALSFISSWDWLMPVVEKIEKLEINDNGNFKVYQRLLSLPIYTEIEIVFKEVIKFIKWYNQNKPS